ncbi:hypothetical protein [Halomonas denitrificans]|nr:hypothetical protein [Halomonas denitrificans]
MSLIAELKRRKVFRVSAAYAVVAWGLAQVADLVLDNTAAPPWVMQVILLLLALGFPLAVLLAWAFEVTPDGVRRTEALAAGEAPPSLRKQDRLLIVLLVAVIAIAGYQFATLPHSGGPAEGNATSSPTASSTTPVEPTANGHTLDSSSDQRASIAVLPFRAMSSGEDDGYFADGLTEEILNSLAQLPELLVTARTSTFHFKDQDLPVPQIAEMLGVGHVLEGSVRRGGDTVRITAQLIRARDGFHLWSDTYDRELEDIFAVQEDIATNVADALDVILDDDKLERMRQAGIDDLDTFIAFQKGREIFIDAHEDISTIELELAAATPLFEQALEISPGFVPAVIYKADALAHTMYASAAAMRAEQHPNEAEDALQALRDELDKAWETARPGNQRDILDVERRIFRDDWTGLGRALERAMQPGDCPLSNWTHEFATSLGDPQAAYDKTREQLLCDPLNALTIFHHAYANLWIGEAERAIELAQSAIDQGIAYAWIDSVEYWARLAIRDFDHPTVRDASGNDGWWGFPKQLVVAAAAGNLDVARAYADEFRASDDANDQSLMVVAAMIGDREAANRFAARIDARPGGGIVLNNAVYSCLCGAPFELAATPNFAQRLQQAEASWPPEPVIEFPAKEW